MLNTEYNNNKTSGIKLVSLYSTIKMMHGPINIRFTNAKKAKIMHEYKNFKRRLHKTTASIW